MKTIEAYDYAESELGYNRYMDPAYCSALRSMAIAPDTHGLDLGCGPGGLFPRFAETMGNRGHLTGIDGSHHHLQAAKQLIRNEAIALPITLQQADFRQRLPFATDTFDWVWAADVMWGHLLPDPTELLHDLCRIVKPGGMIAIFFGNYHRATYFAGYPRLERLIHQATERAYADHRPTAPRHAAQMTMPEERAPDWFAGVPASRPSLSFHPIIYQAPLPLPATRYLHHYLFVEVYLPGVTRFGAEVGMTLSDIALFTALTDPDSDLYILRQPTYYSVQWALLTVATVL